MNFEFKEHVFTVLWLAAIAQLLPKRRSRLPLKEKFHPAGIQKPRGICSPPTGDRRLTKIGSFRLATQAAGSVRRAMSKQRKKTGGEAIIFVM